MMMNYSGPGLWVVSQLLLLVYFKMDNGSNVCGIEFNFNNRRKKEKYGAVDKKEDEEREKEKDDSISLIGADSLLNSEMYYNDQILRQLFFGFQVESEEGRSAI